MSIAVRSTIQALGLVFLIGLFLRLFLFSSYLVSSLSMQPTLWPGDFVVGMKPSIARPGIGSVVVMRCPVDIEPLCLKRVVGLAGDRIEFADGQLIVNGEAKFYATSGAAPASVQNMAPLVVPPKHFFALNDNLAMTDDSRLFGPVPEQAIEARVDRVWLSLDWYDTQGAVRSWPAVRLSRLLLAIH